jgi:hypothetical protein
MGKQVNEEFERLIGSEAIPLDDEYWQTSFKSLGYLLSLPPQSTYEVLKSMCAQLEQNTRTTRHFYKFVVVVCTRLENAASFHDEDAIEPLSVLLFIARLILMFCIGTFEYAQRTAFLEFTHDSQLSEEKSAEREAFAADESNPDKPAHDVSEDLGLRLVRAVFGVVLRLDQGEGKTATDQFRLEVINMLVVLCSTQIYGPLEPGYRNPFLDRMMTPGLYSKRHPTLPHGRVLHFLLLALANVKSSSSSSSSFSSFPTADSVSSLSPPSSSAAAGSMGELGEAKSPAVALSAANAKPGYMRVLERIKGLSMAILRLPSSLYHYLFTAQSSEQIVCAGAALLALILIRQRPFRVRDTRSMSAWKKPSVTDGDVLWEPCANPFQLALQQTVDSSRVGDDEAPVQDVKEDVIRVPFGAVYDVLGKNMHQEWTGLLLYALMNGNPRFREFLFCKSDFDVVVPLLRSLFNKGQQLHSFPVYLLAVNLMSLTEDSGFCENVFRRLYLESVPWFDDTTLTNVSVGSLMLVVLLRTLKLNLLTPGLKDAYLHTNCMAAVVNLAPYAEDMHAYCAAAFMGLLQILSKRLLRVQEQQQERKGGRSHGQDEDVHPMDTEAALVEFTRLLLEATVACICTRPLTQTSNVNLVYWLLHRRALLDVLRPVSALREMATRLSNIIDHFSYVVEQKSIQAADRDASVVMAIITEDIKRWSIPPEYVFTPAKFTYEEEESSAEFFLPYIWCVMHNLRIPWPTENIVLFEIDNADDEEEHLDHDEGDIPDAEDIV